jgi:D-3-phosphoglycerate dehydrogenase
MQVGTMSFRVVILDGPEGPGEIEERELAAIGATVDRSGTRPGSDHRALVADADAIICDATPITASLLDLAPRVQVISEYGIGYDNIDVGAASQRGIWVTNVPGFCADEVADHTVAVILAAGRRLFPLDQSTRSGRWDPVGVAAGADRFSNQTLGLIGFGNIGRRVARRAAGFGLRILAFTPRLTDERAREHGAERCDLLDLIERSDYVSLHLPAGPATRHLIDASTLPRFKPTAWLINAARGSLIDETALLAALRENRLAGAALDVRDPEPPVADDPFRSLPNVILSPHASWFSAQALLDLRTRAARNVAAVLAGGLPDNPVNPYVKPRFGREAQSGPDLWV